MYKLFEAAAAIRLASGCHARCSNFSEKSMFTASCSAGAGAVSRLLAPRLNPSRLDTCTARITNLINTIGSHLRQLLLCHQSHTRQLMSPYAHVRDELSHLSHICDSTQAGLLGLCSVGSQVSREFGGRLSDSLVAVPLLAAADVSSRGLLRLLQWFLGHPGALSPSGSCCSCLLSRTAHCR